MAVIALPTNNNEKQRLEDFATAYADNGGDHIDAYIAAGFSSNTAKQNAKKYLDKHHEYVMSIVRKRMGQQAAMCQKILLTAASNELIPWNNRLKAIEMLLKNSGVQKDTLVLESNKADDLSEEQRDAEIAELMQKLREA